MDVGFDPRSRAGSGETRVASTRSPKCFDPRSRAGSGPNGISVSAATNTWGLGPRAGRRDRRVAGRVGTRAWWLRGRWGGWSGRGWVPGRGGPWWRGPSPSRVPRSQAQTVSTGFSAGQIADAALGQGHAELGRDHPCQVDPSPAHDTMDGHDRGMAMVGPLSHPSATPASCAGERRRSGPVRPRLSLSPATPASLNPPC